MFRTPVCCTAYTNPNDLWLQIRWDGGQELKSLMIAATNWAAIAQAKNTKADVNSLLRNNSLVLAQPDGWNLWFRGRLLGLAEGSGNWLVQLVDFGDRISLPDRPDRLLPIPEFFDEQKLPSYAIRCRLARISQRNDWSKRDSKLLEGLLTMETEDRILEAEIDWEKFEHGSALPVELYQRGSELSINDTFGQRTGSLLAKSRSQRTANFFPTNQSAPMPLTAQPAVEVKVDKSWDKPFDGLVSHVTDQGVVFVQKDEKRLAGLQNQLELFCESENLHRFSASSLPNKDEIFAVFRESPLCHYRGRVVELLGGQRVKLLIVDFGFELTVDWAQCARLPSNIRYKPLCQPIQPLSLTNSTSLVARGIRLNSIWTKVSNSSTPIRVTVSPIDVPDSDPTEVQTARIEVHLTDGSKKDIVAYLLDSDVASTSAQPTNLKSAVNYRQCRQELNWDVDNIVCGSCTHVETGPAPCLFFQPNVMQTVAENLKQQLTAISVDKLEKLEIDSDGLPAPALIRSEDGKTFQRVLVEAADDNKQTALDVTHVDTGEHQAKISIDRLYKLPKELLAVPTTCVKCQLINNPQSTSSIKTGDIKIFTIVGVADGTYKIDIVSSGK